MLILSPGRVAAGLEARSISEEAKARLILFGYALTSLFGGRSLPGYATWGEILLSVVYLGASVAGIWSCFRANQAGDGHSFVERYVCLGVPISVLVFGSYTALYYLGFFALRSRSGFDAASYASTVRPYFMMLSIGALVLFFVVLRRFIRRVAGAPTV
jgi:hypothetical protein